MSPVPLILRDANVFNSDPRPSRPDALILEAWAQGYMVGSLIIMAFITLANMRRGVILHKLILIELIAGLWQGFWLFFPNTPHRRVDTWWLSVAAIPLNASWVLHNIVSWMKIKPFLSQFWSKVFFWSIMLSIPYWIVEIYANFAYFHDGNPIFKETRPLELLFRDPWWVITTVYLSVVIKTQYEVTIKDIIRISPRFGIMLAAMMIAIAFVICDVLSVTSAIHLAGTTGINPFWKLAFVFKCLTDCVILDDFKTALDRLRAFKISRLGSFSGDFSDRRSRNNGNLVEAWEQAEQDAKAQKSEAGRSGHHGESSEGTSRNNSDFTHPSRSPDYNYSHKSAEHQDSFHSTNLYSYPPEGIGLDPEDIVSSAIEGPPLRSTETTTHQTQNSQQHVWVQEDADIADASHLASESDYAAALRDLHELHPFISPKNTNFTTRFNSVSK